MPARRLLAEDAARRLSAAGVESPAYDADVLLAYVLGVERSQLALVDDVPAPLVEQYDALVARRAAREMTAEDPSFAEEAEAIDVQVDDNDLRIDVFRSSGPGGQSVNTTDSAVRITHVPTGIVVSCQNEKSQLQNKEQALRILRARLLAAAQEEADAAAGAARRSPVRTVDRSERIRTYNYPENRISDHRTGYKAYHLDQVLDGALQPVIDSCLEADLQARLDAVEATEH